MAAMSRVRFFFLLSLTMPLSPLFFRGFSIKVRLHSLHIYFRSPLGWCPYLPMMSELQRGHLICSPTLLLSPTRACSPFFRGFSIKVRLHSLHTYLRSPLGLYPFLPIAAELQRGHLICSPILPCSLLFRGFSVKVRLHSLHTYLRSPVGLCPYFPIASEPQRGHLICSPIYPLKLTTVLKFGAECGTRTHNLSLTKRLLCQLS